MYFVVNILTKSDNNIMRYAIAGFGRTGSHWTGELIASITGLPIVFDDCQQWCNSDPAVLHTNQFHNLLNLVPFPEDSLTILCVRDNVFASCISYEVAKYTNEWYEYNNKNLAPFYIDSKFFIEKCAAFKQAQKEAAYDLQQKKIPHFVLTYEKLRAAADPRKYLIDCIQYQGIDHYSGRVAEGNTRNYKDLVINYDQLEEQWLQRLKRYSC